MHTLHVYHYYDAVEHLIGSRDKCVVAKLNVFHTLTDSLVTNIY